MPRRALPNTSLERNANGRAPGTRGALPYLAPRGPGALPLAPAEIKRQPAQMPSTAVSIRSAAEADASAMLEIYRPYVERSAVSFEAEVPSVEEYTSRVCKYLASWAVVVAEVDGRLLGFAHGSAHRERLAYQWSTETTVYVAQGAHRAGTGSRLYAELLPRLARLGYCNAYAGVALPNPASVGLHQAIGFKPIGTFPRVGHKFGRWHDVAWFHLALRDDAPVSPGAENAA